MPTTGLVVLVSAGYRRHGAAQKAKAEKADQMRIRYGMTLYVSTLREGE